MFGAVDISQDVRYAFRALASRPAAAALSISTLALSIGVATAVFSVVNGVLLQPLPYRDAGRLVMAWGVNPEEGLAVPQQRNVARSMSVREYLDWEKDSGVFEDVVAFNSFLATLTDTDDPEGVFGYGSTPGLFQMLGVEPMLGRGFLPEEEQPGGERAYVLMHEFWQRRFRADPGVVGEEMEANGLRGRIVGVMPPGFVFFNRQVDLLLPYPIESYWLESPRNRRSWRVMGRIREGMSLTQAQAQADVFAQRLAQQYPESNAGWQVKLIPVSEESAGHLWPAMRALLGAVCFLLLIACSNVAGLLLVQASVRSKELAVRTAMGAGRWRLMRQMMIESLALGIGGCIAGLGIAWGMVRYFQTLLPDRFAFAKYMLQAEAVQIDPWVLTFALAASVGAALLFGLVPAWRASAPNLVETLNDTGKGSAGGRKGRAVRDVLVVAEVALAVVMVTGAGLLVRSFMKLYQQGAGIQYDNTLTLYVGTPFDDLREQVQREQLRGADAREVFQSAFRTRRNLILEEVAKEPGVESVAAGDLPLSAWYGMGEFYIEGRVDEFSDTPPRAVLRTVTPNYLGQLGIPLATGRGFDERDDQDAPQVAIISQELARRYFSDQDPLGQRIGRGSPTATPDPSRLYTVIGVAGDVHVDGMNRPPPPIVYTAMLQSASPRMSLLVKTRIEPMAMLQPIRDAVRRAVPRASADRARTLEAVVRDSVYEVHYSMLLMSGLALLALALAIVGVYGVLSFSVRERTREIGVRMSLGAERSQVLHLVVRQGVKLAAVGVALGLVAAAGLTRFLATLLFGVEPLDLATFGAVAALLVLAAGLASYAPARRAASVDPTYALRHE